MDRRYSLISGESGSHVIVERDDQRLSFAAGNDEAEALLVLARFIAADIAEVTAQVTAKALIGRVEVCPSTFGPPIDAGTFTVAISCSPTGKPGSCSQSK